MPLEETAPEGRAWRTGAWSQIVSAGGPSQPGHREHVDRLCRTYWKPVFAYIRRAWNKPVEGAKDLTQAFFGAVVAKQTWVRLRPDTGSLRAYLKKALQHFLVNSKEFEEARRGIRPTVSIEASREELERAGQATASDPPEKAFDREWFQILMQSAIADLHTTLEREGKPAHYDVFRAYCVEPEGAEGPTYAQVADALNLKEVDVRNYLSTCRRVLRGILCDRIRDYVDSEDEVERELGEAAGP